MEQASIVTDQDPGWRNWLHLLLDNCRIGQADRVNSLLLHDEAFLAVFLTSNEKPWNAAMHRAIGRGHRFVVSQLLAVNSAYLIRIPNVQTLLTSIYVHSVPLPTRLEVDLLLDCLLELESFVSSIGDSSHSSMHLLLEDFDSFSYDKPSYMTMKVQLSKMLKEIRGSVDMILRLAHQEGIEINADAYFSSRKLSAPEKSELLNSNWLQDIKNTNCLGSDLLKAKPADFALLRGSGFGFSLDMIRAVVAFDMIQTRPYREEVLQLIDYNYNLSLGDDQRTALMICCLAFLPDRIRFLLQHHSVDVNLVDKAGCTALEYLAQRIVTPPFKADSKPIDISVAKELIRMFVAAGANVKSQKRARWILSEKSQYHELCGLLLVSAE